MKIKILIMLICLCLTNLVYGQEIRTNSIDTQQDCCKRLTSCQDALVNCVNINSRIPTANMWEGFAWYKNLPKWAQISISVGTSLIIVSGSIYSGTKIK